MRDEKMWLLIRASDLYVSEACEYVRCESGLFVGLGDPSQDAI